MLKSIAPNSSNKEFWMNPFDMPLSFLDILELFLSNTGFS